MCPSSAKEHSSETGADFAWNLIFKLKPWIKKKVVRCGFYSKPGEALWLRQVLTWRQRGLTVCGWVSFCLSCSIWFYFPDLKSGGQMRGIQWVKGAWHEMGCRWRQSQLSRAMQSSEFLSAASSPNAPWKDCSNSKTFKIIVQGRELLTPFKNSKGDWALVYANKSSNKSVFVTHSYWKFRGKHFKAMDSDIMHAWISTL